MQTLANQVFDFSEDVTSLSENVRSLSEKVSHIEDEVAESRRMLDLVVTLQCDGEKNLSKIGDDVIGLQTQFAVLEQSNEVLREEMGQLSRHVEQLSGRVKDGFAEIKGILMALMGGSGGLRV
ncbi:hypothetical protein L873DRAFT_1789922 [Choiromyces venosus 120613-1]|uniref:Uncharacterized protein n=1 Tax=Choiromyces venosus 120613-1 TaxID=1336337 RepID=A0A3N4JL85_9PEZI|nr:hypothetical protein L873DRAFT_1789922 [Choiromyces venosus 120613-1]